MAIKYSKSINAFYDDVLKYPSLPSDLVELSVAQHQALLTAQSTGKRIVADVNGNPTAVDPDLSQVREIRLNVLSTQCRAAITGGFISSALGSAHTYPSTAADQANLNDALMAGLAASLGDAATINLWCASTGVWIWAPHDVAQVQQVHKDWIAFKAAQQGKLIIAKAAVEAATTADAVNAVAL